MWKASDVMPAPMSRASGCGAASLGVLLGLDDHERTGLAEHEPVAVLVERTRRALGVVVAGRHGTHHRERRDRQRLDAALDTAADGDVGVTHDDLPPRVGDGLRTRRTGRHRGDDAGAGAELQADDRGGTVRHDHLNGERRHLAGAALVHQRRRSRRSSRRHPDRCRSTTAKRSGSTSGVPAVSQSWPPRSLAIRWTYDMRRRSSRLIVVVDGLLEVAADLDRQVPLGDELVLEDADAAFAGQQTLPRALDVRRDRSRRRDGGHHNVGETAVSSGRPGHLRPLDLVARIAAAASGFSSSSFWM